MRKALPALLSLLLLAFVLPARVTAAPDEAAWSAVGLPQQGRAGDWVLAKGSDVRLLAVAADGTLYVHADPPDTERTLFKSLDGGYSWQELARTSPSIVALECSSLSAGVIYVADAGHVYRSSDGGASFTAVGPATMPVLGAGESITCLDVAYGAGGNPVVFVGTVDADSGDYGHVYRFAESDPQPVWTDLEVGGYDVYAIAASPQFSADAALFVAVTDGVYSRILKRGGTGGWSAVAELLKDNAIPFAVTAASGICFPGGQTTELYVGVSGAGGDVYRVTPFASDLALNADVVSLDIAGNAGSARLLAGTAAGQVFLSQDGGATWAASAKPPTGGSRARVALAPDFTTTGRAYAATSGGESALSCSRDGGANWNEVGFIDTSIDSLVDVAPSPTYGQDGTLFLLTFGGRHSLWRGTSGRWERVFSSALPGVGQLYGVELSPGYGASRVVFLAGQSGGQPALWRSSDDGQSFGLPRLTADPASGAHFPIDV